MNAWEEILDVSRVDKLLPKVAPDIRELALAWDAAVTARVWNQSRQEDLPVDLLLQVSQRAERVIDGPGLLVGSFQVGDDQLSAKQRHLPEGRADDVEGRISKFENLTN